MPDIILIQPPNRPLSTPTMYPISLGLLYLASSLEKEGISVEIVDLRDKAVSIELIPKARYYGITATSGEYPDAQILAALLKKRDPQSKTILGGYHATMLYEGCLGFYMVFVGESERSLVEYIKYGLYTDKVFNPLIEDLDNLPFPARDLVGELAFSETLMPGERYGKGERSAILVSARGCPYKCSFCGQPHGDIRFRSPENVAQEVEELKEKYHCSAFRDESDNIAINKKWLLRLCKLLTPLRVRWKAHSRAAHLLDEEKIIALKESGLVEMGMGVESTDQHVLDLTRKEERVENYYQAVALLKKHQIISKVYFMTGLPGEDDETLRLNMEFMRRAKPDKWTLTITMPYPGSDLWNSPEKYGIKILDKDFSRYWNFPDKPVFETREATRDEIWTRYLTFYRYLSKGQWR